ncbi:MAG TPA: hypothetical protein VGO98_02575 [Candidatus Saccharimonadales bacterium]|jgi:hypothetical protein|nr:hypothetical protein [Candidatus Saccharimonadales bacterium]
MHNLKRKNENGAITGSLIAIIVLGILFLAAGSAAIWAYSNYTEQKTNVDGKIDLAVAEARKDQSDIESAKFAEREKEPNRQFVGPDDYGRLTFNYPKTWSAFVAKDVTEGGSFEAYLNPVTVPPVSDKQQYGLRVTIEQADYDKVVKQYDARVKKGDLRSSGFTANGNTGIRFDGNFSKDIRGAAVLLKVRDKTVTVRTDADTFKADFENIVKTINFNQ